MPTPGRAEEQHVGGVIGEPARREVPHQGFVDRGLGGEVEVVEPPGGREVREPHPPGEPAGLGCFNLNREEGFEELGVVLFALGGLVERGGECFGGRGEFEVGEMAPELLIETVAAHQAPPCST